MAKHVSRQSFCRLHWSFEGPPYLRKRKQAKIIMPRLDINDQAFELDNHPLFFYGGEVHYFRMDPSQWRDRLATVKGLGINVVSTYIPWLWHEPEPGLFDFTGHTDPRRNVVDFIALAGQLGLMVFVRPGPYVMSELRQEGLPDWLLDLHPEIIALDSQGRPHPTRMVTYLHPTFLSFVDRWYAAVSEVLAPYFSHNGGPIILSQLDNEVGMLHWVTMMPDQRPDIEKQYQEFLANTAGSAPYGHSDYLQRGVFWREYRAQYLAHLSGQSQRHGWPSPYIINVHGFRDYSIYSRGNDYPIGLSQLFEARHVPGAFLGGDFYPGRVGYDNFHDLALAVTYTAATNAPDAPLFSPEFQSGRFQDRPHIDPSDLDLAARVSVSYGLNGLNWYMLAGGDNPGDIGLFGPRHEWQAPIASDGTLRPSSQVVAHLGALFGTYGSTLAQTKPVTDIHIGFYSAYYLTENPGNPEQAAILQEIVSERDNWHFDGIYRILIAANLTAEAVAVDKEESVLDPERIPVLWMATCRYMDARTQERLSAYVQDGGTLIIGPRVPEWDLAGRPCRILADTLSLPKTTAWAQRGLATILDVSSVFCANYGTLAESSTTEVLGRITRGESQGAIITRQSVDAGQVVVMGCALPDLYQYYHDVVRQLAQAIGCRLGLTLSNASLHATRREGPSGGFLFLHNLVETEQSTTVSLAGNAWHDALEWDVTVPPRSGLMLPYNRVALGHTSIQVMQTDAEITLDAQSLVIHRGVHAGHSKLYTQLASQIALASGQATIEYANRHVTIQWQEDGQAQPIILQFGRNDSTVQDSSVVADILAEGSR
ncbi:MAG: beta-galactosidase [Sulfobacillus thermosulfidooxidans]|nr:MAG: beta-galactosidase [Sulfobacillus thermosulfidooxidans]